MAKKTTYLYKVKASQPGQPGLTIYCYARNKEAAVSGMRDLHPELKHCHFEAVCFAEANYRMYPDLFRQLTPDEVKSVQDNQLADADMYSRRHDAPSPRIPIPENAEFIPIEGDVR